MAQPTKAELDRSLAEIDAARRPSRVLDRPVRPDAAPAKPSRALNKAKGLTGAGKVGAGAKAAGHVGTAPKGSQSTRSRSASSTGTAALSRVVGHALLGTAKDIVTHPIDAAEKTAKFAGETAKGVASTAIALPIYAAEYPVKKALGVDAGDSPLKIAGRIAETTAKSYAKKYGPSYRGEPGAAGKLAKQIEKEGPGPTLLDLSTAIAPGASGGAKAARVVAAGRVAKGAKPGIIGKVGKATESRPALRTTPLKAGEKQQVRDSLTGAAVAAGHDTARAAAQKLARARASERLRVRVAKRLGVKARHIEGRKPHILNTEPRPLSPRRAALRPGEVAPLSRRLADRRLRKSTAIDVGRGQAAAQHRVARHVTSPRGDTLRRAFNDVPVELHHAALTATQLGIRGSKSAPAILVARLAEIERNRAAALAGELGGKARAAELHGAKSGADEAAKLRDYLADPTVFDRPDVLAAAETAARRVVGPREGLNAERAAHGRSALVGETLGVKTAKAEHAEAKAAQVEARAATNAGVSSARKAVEKAGRRVALLRATTREAAIGQKLGGRVRVGDKATLKSIARHEMKGKKSRVGIVGGIDLVRAERELAGAKTALAAAKTEHKAAGAPLKRRAESAVQYEARVAAAAAERGLAAPAHVPSRFETKSLSVGRSAAGAPANPLSKARTGVLYRLGREDKSLDVAEGALTANLRRGAAKEAESVVLGRHGIAFRNAAEATRYAEGLGMNVDPRLGPVDVALHQPGMAAKGLAKPLTSARGRRSTTADAGAYDKTRDVFLLPKAVKDELDALDIRASSKPSMLSKLGHYPQAALLALSPSWFQFQRVNDIIASLAGGSLHNTVALEKLRRGLGADSREALSVFSGGSIGSSLLVPSSAQKLGRLQRILDKNPVYQRAFGGDNPATALLRADQAITGAVRERQLLHNLLTVARKLDPDVKAIHQAFGPIGHAFKTGDVELAQKLLTNPAYRAQLEDAAERLYKVHGDWHNYTSREQRFKAGAAFYGFLRYATRMAFYTLPIEHPYVGMMIAQLGQMGTKDAKAIIGPDIPYGLGTLYNSDGTIAADFARANPLTGPLLSITKPEQALTLATPLAGIVLNWLTGMPLGLGDSSEGRPPKAYTANGNPNPREEPIGGLLGDARLRIGADQLLSLLSPYKEWRKFDGRQQSSDSLAFDRRYLQSATAAGQLKLDKKNANTQDGLVGLAHNLFPVVATGSARNMKTQGAIATSAKADAEYKRKLAKAKRDYRLKSPEGALDRQLELIDAAANAGAEDATLKELDKQLKLIDARTGG